MFLPFWNVTADCAKESQDHAVRRLWRIPYLAGRVGAGHNEEAELVSLADWIGRFVQESLKDEAVERFIAVTDAEIVARLPELAADPMLVQELHASTRHQWLTFLAGLRQPEHALSLPSQAADLARSLARRGMEVRVLLRVYLSAHHGVFAYVGQVIDSFRGEAPVPEELLRTVWRRADLWMDESVESLIETFYEERQRELSGVAVRRAELVDALIAGKQVDTGQAAATLRHPLHGWHTAFVVWTDQVDGDTSGRLRAAAEQIASALTDGVLLAQLVGSRDLRCWVGTSAEPVDAEVDALGSPAIDGVSVAIGRPGVGVAGFRSSHLDAVSAQRLALASARAPRFVDYRDVEMLCLALGERDALVRMVRRELGPLCAADKNAASLRETVLTLLANRMNVEAAAERLFLHGNTVRYRVAKAEQLLGYQLVERPRHLELALQYIAYFGPPQP